MRVLVTRPIVDARATARRLRRLGHRPMISPVIEVVATPPLSLLANGTPDALLVTSGNALRAIARHPDRHALAGIPLLAVGARTATLARRHGFRDVEAAEGDALSLISLATSRLRSGSMALHLAGADLARDLRSALASHGITVENSILYRAEPATLLRPKAVKALETDQIDAILHYSPRSARLFAALVTAAGLAPRTAAIAHLCLSKPVAEALEPLRPQRVLIAGAPDENALFALLRFNGL